MLPIHAGPWIRLSRYAPPLRSAVHVSSIDTLILTLSAYCILWMPASRRLRGGDRQKKATLIGLAIGAVLNFGLFAVIGV